MESTGDYNAEAQNPALFIANAADAVKSCRNHPSIVMWCACNKGVPQPILTNGFAKMLCKLDGTRYHTSSSNRVNLRDSGPYKYQDSKLYFNVLHHGFSVELGIPLFSTLESFKSLIAPANQWPLSDAWTCHDWHTGKRCHSALYAALGRTVRRAYKAQMLNYTLH